MKKNQGLAPVVIIIAILVLVAVGGGAYYAGTSREKKEDDTANISTRSEIEGNKDDLVNFSVKPGDTISGVLDFNGTVKNAYFFEGNIGINALDENKNVLKRGNAMATTEWMTSEPVSFEGSIDLTGLPSGPGYIQIANDNPSDRRDLDKFIFIPIVIGQSRVNDSVSISLDMTNQYAKMYKTLFTAEFTKEANLDGHFRVVAPGCGTSCVNIYALDKNTGKVYVVGNGGAEYQILDNQIRVTGQEGQVIIYIFNSLQDRFQEQAV